ncbi:hypothetical protein [Haloplanus halobius]|uniref:hypothetical protein n=1 Tax=Haloplanus halobius TaxID=2934938 RepID=UPI00200D11C7|nr:hypothetical protein [Haloplanus sp. XH21]
MPSTRLPARTRSAVAIALAVIVTVVLAPRSFTGVAVAQSSMGSELSLGARLGIRFGVVLVINLVLGGALYALAPDYAEEMVTAIRDDMGGAFLWGILLGIGLPIALVLLAITIIGLLITIPGLLALFVVGLIGNAVTILWIGGSLTSAEELDLSAVGVGSLALAVLAAIPILGNLATTALGFFGLGVVGRDVYTSWRE